MHRYYLLVISMHTNEYRYSSYMVSQQCHSYPCMNMYVLIGNHRLLDLVIVIPSCLLAFQLEKCGNLCECTHIQSIKLQNSENYWLCGSKKFYIHYPQLEICVVDSFDTVEKNRQHKYVGSTLIHRQYWFFIGLFISTYSCLKYICEKWLDNKFVYCIFNTLLPLFLQLGINRMGQRKRLVDAIFEIHKKDWQPNSLTTTPVQYTKKITWVWT